MVVKTGRFGQLNVNEEEIIKIPQGMLGFPEYTEFCLVDPGDDTLILWLQSLQNPNIAFAVLEPKIFKPDYVCRLSDAELRELQLANIQKAAVFNILTIPEDVTLMTANCKAPLVINLTGQIARQVVLQENEYTIKHSMFKELKAHLVTIASSRAAAKSSTAGTMSEAASQPTAIPVGVKDLPASSAVKTLRV